MEFFINELSFEGQHFENLAAQESMKQLVEIIDVIINRLNDLPIFKSDLLLYSSLKTNEQLVSTLEHFPKELKLVVKKRIYDSTTIVDWNSSREQDVNVQYFCETTKKSVTNTSLAEAAERKMQDNLERYLLNIMPSSYSQLTHTTVTKKVEPALQSSLNCISNEENLKSHFQLDRIHPDDYLRNNPDFVKTKFDVQGRVVFQRIENGEFWYLDNLHRNHFEVFSQKLIHFGEANLDGGM